MTTIAINLIDPNPYRDFSIYPIVQEQVDILKSSFATRDFGVIAVRPVAGRYQQVYGHHRIEALRQMGVATIDCKVESIDDDQMVKEMSAENATQQGNSFPAQVDSVAAIIRRLAFWLLISEDAEQFNKVCATAQTSKGFESLKGKLLAGSGLGRELVLEYAPAMSRSGVEGAIGYLKESGLMTGIVGKVQAQVEALQAAADAEEKKRKAEAEKARQEAVKAEKEAIAKAKEAAKAAAAATAARKAQAEADAKVAADRAAKLAEAREVEAEKEAERRAEEAKKQAAARKAADDAAKAQREFAEKVAGMHPDCLTLLRGERHMRAWRPIVTAHPKVFPVQQQPDMIREMYATMDAAKGGAEKTTFEDVARWCNDQVGNHDAEYQRQLEANKRQREASNKADKARGLVEELRASMNRYGAACDALARACDADPELTAHVIDLMGYTMPTHVDRMEVTVEVLRSRFGVKSNRDPKRVEKAIPEYVEPLQVK